MKIWFVSVVVAFAISYGLVVNLDSSFDFPHTIPQIDDDWRIEIIANTNGAMMETSIAVDNSSIPHAAFYPPGEIKYGKRDLGGWVSEQVNTTPFGGAPLCMALDLSQNPHIIYDGLGWIHAWSNQGFWEFEKIPSPGGGRKECDATFDSKGHLHVAYATELYGGTQGDIKYAFFDGFVWSIEEVDKGGIVSTWASVDIDSSDTPHILYYGDVYQEVRYAVKAGGNWSIESVENVGHILYSGKHGSIALDSLDIPQVAYLAEVKWPESASILKYGVRYAGSWQIQAVNSDGMEGFFPGIEIDSEDVPSIGYQSWGHLGSDLDLMFAAQVGTNWSVEKVYDDPLYGVAFPSFALDRCGNPHIAFHVYTDKKLKYATKGEPCPPEPDEEASTSLDVDPDTLNLKSKGRWITAYLSAENASIYDIDISSILLQDTLVPERYDYQDDVLMLKFNRGDFKNTVVVGESVQVKITGKWKDGSDFEAYDYIRVVNPGKHQVGI